MEGGCVVIVPRRVQEMKDNKQTECGYYIIFYLEYCMYPIRQFFLFKVEWLKISLNIFRMKKCHIYEIVLPSEAC